MVVEYLERFHCRRKYGYVQATDEGVAEFQEEVKKLLLARESYGERVVLFEDKTGFSLHPKLWGKKETKSYIYTKSQVLDVIFPLINRYCFWFKQLWLQEMQPFLTPASMRKEPMVCGLVKRIKP